MENINVGNKIRELRRAQNFTLRQLAELLEVTHTAVSLWESGRREPDLKTVVKLSQIFFVSVDELLDPRQDYIQMKFPKKENVVGVVNRNGENTIFILDDNNLKTVESLVQTLSKNQND